MPNALPHKEDEAKQAQRLADSAHAVGMQCLTTSTLYLAQHAVSIVYDSAAEVSLKEAAKDLQAIRHDPAFVRAMDDDITASIDAVEELLLEAMEDGLESEMAFQVTQFKGMTFKISIAEREQMHGYPIQGHTCNEISAFMHNSLRYETDGVLGGPLVGDSSVKAIPQYLGGVVNRFADRVSSAVQEAFYAGIQLAMRMTAQAVSDAH